MGEAMIAYGRAETASFLFETSDVEVLSSHISAVQL